MSRLAWLESSSLSTWLRESDAMWALPGALFMHSLAMGVVAGLCGVLCLRARGMAATYPSAALREFLPLISVAWWTCLISGLLLLVAYPTKALTNPVFFLKLAAVATAWLAWRQVGRGFYGTDAAAQALAMPRTQRLAAVSVLAWLAAIVLGRLLAYTYRHLLASAS